ncbi:hypothetical protein SAY87_011888 [Trapa incisa]|uniref:Chromatin structure-remodeling complex protein BSH n=1 Tax=Trapa incisa TaxID=236973 RepID=A0AAN7GJZ3_9MYRT|nr:hypothetical protein SAY87_011888 [Trapa incisa]
MSPPKRRKQHRILSAILKVHEAPFTCSRPSASQVQNVRRFILSPQNHLHFVLQSLLFYSSDGYSATRLDSSSPTKDNLVPIRLDIEIDGQRFKDAFTWNPVDPDSESEVVVFAKRTVKDLKHPPEFITQIVQSIQSQLTDFRSYEGQDMYAGEKIISIKDMISFKSDSEEFACIFCRDMDIHDLNVGHAVVFAIREQLYEIFEVSIWQEKAV